MRVYGLSATLSAYYKWHARFYDLTRWTFLFGRSRLIGLVGQYIRPRRILEIGCGTGRNLAELARRFPSAEIVGVDLSREMLDKAQRKLARYGEQVSLKQCLYNEPISSDNPFDLIVFSYCLSMINPGFSEVLRICQQDLSPSGLIGIVDFHDTPFRWFRDWMCLNHVRFDGQILSAITEQGLRMQYCDIRPAYRGVWRWVTCFSSRIAS